MDSMSLSPVEEEQEIQLVDSEEEGGGNGRNIPVLLFSNTYM
jgi:hypothetical protein